MILARFRARFAGGRIVPSQHKQPETDRVGKIFRHPDFSALNHEQYSVEPGRHFAQVDCGLLSTEETEDILLQARQGREGKEEEQGIVAPNNFVTAAFQNTMKGFFGIPPVVMQQAVVRAVEKLAGRHTYEHKVAVVAEPLEPVDKCAIVLAVLQHVERGKQVDVKLTVEVQPFRFKDLPGNSSLPRSLRQLGRAFNTDDRPELGEQVHIVAVAAADVHDEGERAEFTGPLEIAAYEQSPGLHPPEGFP